MTYTIGKNTYTAHKSGLYFSQDCPDKLRDVIATLNTTNERARVFYGDVKTGKAWAEENDVCGTIARSMGPCKVPLLVARSGAGGSALLDGCIVAILTANTFVYRVDGFDVGAWDVAPSDMPGYLEAVTHDGTVHARFKKAGQAVRYCAFMRGERMVA